MPTMFLLVAAHLSLKLNGVGNGMGKRCWCTVTGNLPLSGQSLIVNGIGNEHTPCSIQLIQGQ
eukprot:6188057-Pleurochrysis_carterae.AAC.3